MDQNNIREFLDEEHYDEVLPFVSKIALDDGSSYSGVMINSDKNMISFIDLSKIRADNKLYDFLELCLQWWWYSNKKIPINLYFPEECAVYMAAVTHIPMKNATVTRGHFISLQTIVDEHKPHRRNISLSFPD